MNRCARSFGLICLLVLLTLGLGNGGGITTSAYAQVTLRALPQGLKFSHLEVTQAPQVLLGGKPDRLSPGARVLDPDNRLLLSGSLAGQKLPVLYRREMHGLIHEVWLLRPDEARLLERARGEKAQAEAIEQLRRR